MLIHRFAGPQAAGRLAPSHCFFFKSLTSASPSPQASPSPRRRTLNTGCHHACQGCTCLTTTSKPHCLDPLLLPCRWQHRLLPACWPSSPLTLRRTSPSTSTHKVSSESWLLLHAGLARCLQGSAPQWCRCSCVEVIDLSWARLCVAWHSSEDVWQTVT